MVFTTRFSGGRGGRNGFESELHRLGILHQTLKRWLGEQPTPETLDDLQALLDKFVASVGPSEVRCSRTLSVVLSAESRFKSTWPGSQRGLSTRGARLVLSDAVPVQRAEFFFSGLDVRVTVLVHLLHRGVGLLGYDVDLREELEHGSYWSKSAASFLIIATALRPTEETSRNR